MNIQTKSTILSLFVAALLLFGGCAARQGTFIPLSDPVEFEGLSDVRVVWEQYADGMPVAGGESSLHAPAGPLRLHLAPLEGIYENHVLLTFLRPDGSEIARRCEELAAADKYVPSDINDLNDPLTVISDIHPVLSQDFNPAEEQILASEDHSAGGEEKYYSKTRYRSGTAGSFLYEMEYTIAPTAIHVDYTITPEEDAGQGWGPLYGIAYKPRGLRGLRYVGLNPAFGLWTYDGGIKEARSVLIDLWQGTMRIDGGQFVEVDPARPEEVLILREAAAAPFSGSFTITIR